MGYAIPETLAGVEGIERLDSGVFMPGVVVMYIGRQLGSLSVSRRVASVYAQGDRLGRSKGDFFYIPLHEGGVEALRMDNMPRPLPGLRSLRGTDIGPDELPGEIQSRTGVVLPPARRIVPIRGVYFLLDGDEIVYIGQTMDLVARMPAHFGSYGKVFDPACVFYQPVPESDLIDREADLIIRFMPRYNVPAMCREEICEYYGISPQHFDRLHAQGLIPPPDLRIADPKLWSYDVAMNMFRDDPDRQSRRGGRGPKAAATAKS